MARSRLLQGDCVQWMKKLKSKSVDLTVTSPPYDNLRAYNGNNEQWCERVWKAVISELYRVTKFGGVVVWVVGDATIKGSETGTSFKQALYAKEVGFNLHDTMIFAKINPKPLTHNRYEQQFEYMFVLVKGKLTTFNALKDKCKNAGKAPPKGRGFYTATQNTPQPAHKSELIKEFKQRGNIWHYAVGSFAGTVKGHPAQYPIQLAVDHILSWSNNNDTVLDPFMGSGTTGVACKKLGRNFIGVELDETYFNLAKRRIKRIEKEGC